MHIEFINSLTSSGLPPYKSTWKEGAIVYIVRNLISNTELVNGQKLKIMKLYHYSILEK